MMNFLANVFAGVIYPLAAISTFYRSPQLLNCVFIPVVINIFVGIFLYISLLIPGWIRLNQFIDNFSDVWASWIDSLPLWLRFLAILFIGLSWVLKGILILGLLGFIGFLLVQFGTLLGAPWYGQLSEQLERLKIGTLETIEVSLLEDIRRAIVFELKKVVLLICGGVFFFLLHFLPGIGSILTGIGSFTLAITLICLDFLDPPLERRRLKFRAKLRFILSALPGTASFGFICLFLVSIPVINLFTVPICVAAGTLFYCDRFSRNHSLS